MTVVESLVLGNLRSGPRTLEDLARACGVDRRSVEEAVETLRIAGEPIIAGNIGLQLTDDPDVLAAYLDARDRRARTILRARRPLRATVTRLRQRDMTLGLR